MDSEKRMRPEFDRETKVTKTSLVGYPANPRGACSRYASPSNDGKNIVSSREKERNERLMLND